MDLIRTIFQETLSDLSAMRVADAIDILIVAFLIYRVIMFVRKTNSYNLTKGILLLLVVLGASYVLQLHMINFLLRNAVELGLIAVVILSRLPAPPPVL